MKKIAQIGLNKTNVYSDLNVLIIDFTNEGIVLGKHFTKLSQDAQRTFINYSLLAVEYVNLNKDAVKNKDLRMKLDIYMNQKAFNHNLILHTLKETHKLLSTLEEQTDQVSEELIELSERYYAFSKYCKSKYERVA